MGPQSAAFYMCLFSTWINFVILCIDLQLNYMDGAFIALLSMLSLLVGAAINYKRLPKKLDKESKAQ